VSWNLEFHNKALREWRRLDPSIRVLFLARLEHRLFEPVVEKDRLRGELSNCFKLRLLASGYRLVYEVIESEHLIFVRSVGHRSDKQTYGQAENRTWRFTDS
jgi:mRNA interferase RelE/StbE